MESSEGRHAKLNEPDEGLLHLEEALHETSDFLNGILENSRDMIFRTDSDGTLVFFGKGGESILGYASEELTGREIKELAEDPQYFENLAVGCLKDKQSVREEISFLHKTGRTVYCRMALSPLTDSRGEVTGMAGICRDYRLAEVQGRPHPRGPAGRSGANRLRDRP
jgi:PAS domain S-box-containing protein